jgi:hypothetical protein
VQDSAVIRKPAAAAHPGPVFSGTLYVDMVWTEVSSPVVLFLVCRERIPPPACVKPSCRVWNARSAGACIMQPHDLVDATAVPKRRPTPHGPPLPDWYTSWSGLTRMRGSD